MSGHKEVWDESGGGQMEAGRWKVMRGRARPALGDRLRSQHTGMAPAGWTHPAPVGERCVLTAL